MRRAFLLLPVLLAACDQNMVQQARYDEYESAPLYPDGMAMQAPPAGTIDRATPQRIAAAKRPPLTPALLARGRERFEIYCSVCHGSDGRGDGVVPARGFPQPPSYLEPRLVAAPTAHFYDVITNGYGVMYSYADRVPPRDRWAIAAYIRALQVAGSGDAAPPRHAGLVPASAAPQEPRPEGARIGGPRNKSGVTEGNDAR